MSFFHPRWTFRAFWALWRMSVYVGAFAFHELPPHYWTYVWGSFLPIEIWGGLRKSKHDTLSETHWFFGERGWAFRIWGIAHAVLYGYLASIYPEYTWGFEPSIPWDIFCCGLSGWLIVHFALLGKEG